MNKLKILVLSFCLSMSVLPSVAQEFSRYRVSLIDKKGTDAELSHPEKFLSERALQRRQRQHLPITESDLPVSKVYVNQLLAQGVTLVTSSKWNNTVVVESQDSLLEDRLAKLPFVKSVRKVWKTPSSVSEKDPNRKDEVTNFLEKQDDSYGCARQQIAIHGGDRLHEAGFTGKGMQVAVIDAGFYNADTISFFNHLKLMGTHDFVNAKSDLYAEHEHGMMVLSCMAASQPNTMVGTAPDASFWLLRSEDNDTEQPIEEDHWAAAVEFADSVGVDVINTSLGYYSFDEPFWSYKYRELDGHTSLMSNTASQIAQKGMVLVCSAGNSGMRSWKKITPPGDAQDIITVGALRYNLVNADFSSIGNTADGRVKPDVMAIGESATVSSGAGTVSEADGTSFAAPIFCGVVTCFWQACPWLTAKEVVEIVRASGDRSAYPDNIYGYGVANLWEAYQKCLQKKEVGL